MFTPFATRPAQSKYCRFTPGVAPPCFSWPVFNDYTLEAYRKAK